MNRICFNHFTREKVRVPLFFFKDGLATCMSSVRIHLVSESLAVKYKKIKVTHIVASYKRRAAILMGLIFILTLYSLSQQLSSERSGRPKRAEENRRLTANGSFDMLVFVGNVFS